MSHLNDHYDFIKKYLYAICANHKSMTPHYCKWWQPQRFK